jgi:NTE family protein
MPKMGLVLQGGGALGAYEYGAVTRLVELGWHPVAITGVSIGAATAAAVAGAREGDIGKSLRRLWEAITLAPVPFLPADRQATFSMFGNPRFWRMRGDLFSYREWTSFYDVSAMRETLKQVCEGRPAKKSPLASGGYPTPHQTFSANEWAVPTNVHL